MKEKIKNFRFTRKAFAYPYMLFLLVFVVTPLVLILANAFIYDGKFSFKNFAIFFTEKSSLVVLGNSILVGLLTTIICIVLGYPAAYFLAKYSASKIFVLLFILPMWVIGFVCLWQYAGQSMMLYMAQISGISKSIYEASYIDGCTKTKSFRYITIPLIKPMVGTAVSLNAIGSLKFFDLIFNMTEGGPNHRTEVLATHLYLQGFKHNKYGYASTIGVILLALCLITTGVINKFFKTENYEM